MEAAMADIKVLANKVRNKLKFIEQNFDNNSNISPADLRIQKTQVDSCAIQFLSLLKNFTCLWLPYLNRGTIPDKFMPVMLTNFSAKTVVL